LEADNEVEDVVNETQSAPLRSWLSSIENGDRPEVPTSAVPHHEPPSRASVEPAEIDLQGQYVGPASGVALFQRVKERLNQGDRTPATFTFGDIALPEFDPTFIVMVSQEETTRLLQKYFDFTVPVDRFLLKPTLESWLGEFHETMGVMHHSQHAPAQRAILWMVFAMAQEHISSNLSATEDNKRYRLWLRLLWY
jgi:hypothetical protein